MTTIDIDGLGPLRERIMVNLLKRPDLTFAQLVRLTCTKSDVIEDALAPLLRKGFVTSVTMTTDSDGNWRNHWRLTAAGIQHLRDLMRERIRGAQNVLDEIEDQA